MPSNDQVILTEVLKQRREELSTPISESTYFELFAGEQILKDYDLSWEEIESGIVGDSGDGGIDGFYLFLNSELIREDTDLSAFRGDISLELHIFQAKRTSGFSEDAIHKLRATTEDILDLSTELNEYSSVYNSQLLLSAAQFREAYRKFASKLPKLSIAYYYATQGDEVHPNVERLVAPLRQSVSRLFSSAKFSFDFLGARELLELTRRRPRTMYELKLSDSPISTENNAYICLVDLDNYVRFITNEEGNYVKAIFDANVRDHQGDVQVNRGIRETLNDPQGEDFWWLNNGITVLAQQAVLSAKTLTLENPRVVNGLQTSLEIFRYYSQGEDIKDDRRLLVRVIVPEENNSYERIIRATNSQTTIPIASLRATDKVHRDIEDFFRGKGLYYDRRKNQYKNEGKPLDRIITIGYVAQAVMTIVLGRPDDARARPSTLLKNDKEYIQVFNEDYPPGVFLVSTLVLKRTETYLRSTEFEYSRKDINNIKFYVAMFATWLSLNTTSPHSEDIANLDIDLVDDALLESSRSEIWRLYTELGADDQVAKGTTLVERVKQQLQALTYEGRVTD